MISLKILTTHLAAGMADPDKFVVQLGSEETDPSYVNLSELTSAVLEVLWDGKTEPVQWTTVQSGAVEVEGGSEVTLTHTLAAAELDRAGIVYVRARVEHPTAGTAVSRSRPMPVQPPFA